jgi:NADP-dependent 3-hydroxy acid dehydrogenase YdfG
MANELVLITGASSDIGCALARRLLTGTNPPTILAHAYQSADRLQDLRAEFGDLIHPLRADLSQPAEVSAMVDEIARALASLPKSCISPHSVSPTTA